MRQTVRKIYCSISNITQNTLISGANSSWTTLYLRVNSQGEQFKIAEQDSKLRNLEELEAARAKEAWEKHVVSDKLVAVRVRDSRILPTGLISKCIWF